MKTTLEIELRPFELPEFARAITSLSNKDDQQIPIHMLDGNTLLRMCDEFRDSLFSKYDVQYPPQPGPRCPSCNP